MNMCVKNTLRVLLAAATTAAFVVPLAACAQPEARDGTAGGGAGAQSSDSTAAAAGEIPATDGDADAATGTQALQGAACLEGDWLADNSYFLAAIREFGDEIKSVEGEVIVSFRADETMETTYRGWLITAVAEGQTITIQRDGVDTGTYSAGDTTLAMKDTAVGSSLVMSGDGFQMAVDAEPVDQPSASYTCAADTAVITTTDGAMQLMRR
ncbi:MAG: hypothetical protein GX862_02995 [Leucobacter sp.]|nr:hypothetical protein [Leucobacter sp.]